MLASQLHTAVFLQHVNVQLRVSIAGLPPSQSLQWWPQPGLVAVLVLVLALARVRVARALTETEGQKEGLKEGD